MIYEYKMLENKIMKTIIMYKLCVCVCVCVCVCMYISFFVKKLKIYRF